MITRKTLIIAGITVSVVLLLILLILSFQTQFGRSSEAPEPTPTTLEDIIDRTPPLNQEALDQIQESNRLNAPDVYLHNQLPVVQPTFNIDAYIDRARSTFVFRVYPKTDSLLQVQQDVNDWLLSIGLTQDQIDSLVIEYQPAVN